MLRLAHYILGITVLWLIALGAQETKRPPDLELERIQKNFEQQIEESRQSLEQELRETAPPPQAPVIRVILAPFRRTVLSAQISTPILSSQVSAPVKKIYYRMGESFKEGDVLMQIDESVFGANLQSSISELDRANVVLKARKSLFHDDISSLVDLKDAEAISARSEAQLALAKNQFDASTIIAPYNGKVVSLNIEEFELPQPGQALMEIQEDEIMLAKILVPSNLLNLLQIGKEIKIAIQETGTTHNAKIIRIGAAIDPSSSTIAVDAEIDNRDQLLMPGMVGTTTLN